MEHVALYRQFRPKNFDEIVEQKAAVSTLRQTVKTGRIGHAYLFCGQRGTGKTSIARVFSRAINCENPENGNPCNKCPTCTGILSGSLMDVIEIDAASNRSIDNIRKICEEVTYSPSKAPHKVYIIDEVHMITSEGFNALLKTLEEPPAHAVFLFATTEPHSIPATILSRCQRFDFRRISQESIINRLRYISSEEKINIEEDALKMIASLSDGAMRDAISMLDQAGSSSNGKLITAETIEEMTGSVNKEFLGEMAEILLDGRFDALLISCGKLAESGRDLIHFTLDLAQYFRDLLVVRTLPDPTGLLTVSNTTLKRMYEIASKTNSNTLVAFISSLSKTVTELKWSPSVRTTFEITLLRLCGRSIKADEVPLVIPDFSKLQSEAAAKISSRIAESASTIDNKPEIKTEVSPSPAPATENEQEESKEKQANNEEKEVLPEHKTISFTPIAEKKPEVIPEPEEIVSINMVMDEDDSDSNSEEEVQDTPMENQLDLFSFATPEPEPVSEEKSSEPLKVSPTPTIPFDSKPEKIELPKEKSNNIFANLSGNFLDDISIEPETTKESDVYKPTGRIGETKKTRLSEMLDTTPIAESKVVKEISPFDVWNDIITRATSEDFTLATLLKKAEFKYEDNSAFILFENENKQIIKNLISDPSYKSISVDLKKSIDNCEHVYLCTYTQYQNMINLKNGMINNNSGPSKAEDFINSSKQLGINTEIHFGD